MMSRGFRDEESDDSFEIADAMVKAETEKAILVTAPFLDEETWVPQSQVADESEVWKRGDMGTLVVTAWFARQRGWVED